MLYRYGLRNDNKIFEMIQKRESVERLTEGQVKVNGNNISNNDIFPATMVFKDNITFKFELNASGYFCFGLCDKNNYYRNILIDVKHRTIRRKNVGNGDVMGFNLPIIREKDEIQLSYDNCSMFLTINGETHNVWNISDYRVDEWKIFCYMENGTIVYNNS